MEFILLNDVKNYVQKGISIFIILSLTACGSTKVVEMRTTIVENKIETIESNNNNDKQLIESENNEDHITTKQNNHKRISNLKEQVINAILLDETGIDDSSLSSYYSCVKSFSDHHLSKDFYYNNRHKINFDFDINGTEYFDQPNDFELIDDCLKTKLYITSGKQIKEINVQYNRIDNEITNIENLYVKNVTDENGKIYHLNPGNIVTIFSKLIEKNSNWDGLPLSDGFKSKFNSNDGLFGKNEIDKFEITENGLTSYLNHIVDITKSYKNANKRYLIKFDTSVNPNYVYHSFKNYIYLDDAEIIEVDSPVVINEIESSIAKYKAKLKENDYTKSIKTFIYNKYNTEYNEWEDGYKETVGVSEHNAGEEDEDKGIFKCEIINESELLVSNRFREKYINSNDKKIDVLKYNYLGCNLEKQLYYVHIVFSFDNEQTQLWHWTIDENGLMDDLYIVDIEYLNYGHSADIPYELLWTDTLFDNGFDEMFNMNPYDDRNVIDMFYYSISSDIQNKYMNLDILPYLYMCNRVDIVKDDGLMADYYNKKIFVDEYFNDYVIRYEINFNINDMLELVSFTYSELGRRENVKKYVDDYRPYYISKTKNIEKNYSEFIHIISQPNRDHLWNKLMISDKLFEMYGNRGIFNEKYDDDMYLQVTYIKETDTNQFEISVEHSYKGAKRNYECHFIVEDGYVKDIIIKETNN